MSKKRVLYITHAYDNRGGVEEHLKTLNSYLEPGYDCFVAYPEGDKIHLHLNGEILSSFDGLKDRTVLSPIRDKTAEESIDRILKEVEPEIVHIMHFLYWPLSVVPKIAQLQVKKLISFHDYFALTPHFTMMGRSDVPNFCSADYAQSVFGNDISQYLTARRDLLRQSLPIFSHRILPSRFLQDQLTQIFPFPYTTIPYGIEPMKRLATKKSKKLRFGYMGARIPQKGWKLLVSAFGKALEQQADIELHIHGDGEKEIEADGVTYHGPYSREDLPKCFSTFDIGVIPSLFPETYSIVLSELWAAQKPVCVSRIGALDDRVVHGVSGIKFQAGNVDDLTKTLLWHTKDNSWQNYRFPSPHTAAQMTEQILELYES